MHAHVHELESDASAPGSTRLRQILVALALPLCVFAVYAQVARHDFVHLDTGQYITANPHVLAGLTADSVRWAFTAAHSGNWHPLTWLSHMLDIELFGVAPGAHALVNVALHAANTLLVFFVLQRMTKAFAQSVLVALLFALHPLHVESVAWVVERKDVLSTFFGLASMWFYVGWAQRQRTDVQRIPAEAPRREADARRARWSYGAALFCYALSLMSKSMLVTLPCLLLVLDHWPLGRRSEGYKRLVLEKLPFVALAVVCALLTVWAQSAGGTIKGLAEFSFAVRIENAFGSYLRYIMKTVWPLRLAAFYPHLSAGQAAVEVMLAPLALIALSFFAFRARRTAPYLLVGWLWFLGTLVPVIGIVQVGEQAMADRYTYVPSIGLFIAVAFGLADLARRSATMQTALRAGTLVALCALTFLTWKQIGTWKNTRVFSEHILEVTADNYVAHEMLATALMEAGELEPAAKHYREALRIAPSDGYALENLGKLLLKMGRVAEAEQQFRTILRYAPNHANAHSQLALCFEAGNRNAEALEEHRKAVRFAPNDAEILARMAYLLERMGQLDEAEQAYARAVQLWPGWAFPVGRLDALRARRKNAQQ